MTSAPASSRLVALDVTTPVGLSRASGVGTLLTRAGRLSALIGLVRFGLVGLSGMVVNLVVLTALLRLPRSVPATTAQAVAETVATQVAIVWNFALTEGLGLPPHARLGGPARRGSAGFWAVCMVGPGRATAAEFSAGRRPRDRLRRGHLGRARDPGGRPLRPVPGLPLPRRGRSDEGRPAMTATLAPDIAPFGWLAPPSDEEKLLYLRAPQHRWIFVVSAVAFVGVAASLAGFATQTYWTAVFLLPLALLVVEQVISLRTSTLRRRVTLPDHQFLVETYAPEQPPVGRRLPPHRGGGRRTPREHLQTRGAAGVAGGAHGVRPGRRRQPRGVRSSR